MILTSYNRASAGSRHMPVLENWYCLFIVIVLNRRLSFIPQLRIRATCQVRSGSHRHQKKGNLKENLILTYALLQKTWIVGVFLLDSCAKGHSLQEELYSGEPVALLKSDTS